MKCRSSCRTLSAIALSVALCLLPTAASAQGDSKWTDWGYITLFGTAWNDDALSVEHSAPFESLLVAPTRLKTGHPGCTVPGSYATNPTNPGRHLLHASIIGAYLNHKQIRFLLQGCQPYGKPNIIAVEVRDG